MKFLAVLTVLCSMMTAGQVSGLLTRQAKQGATPATLWNLGFELYYRHGFAQKEMAQVLAQAYGSARGFDEAQKAVFQKAAAFWQKELDNWPRDHIPDQDRPAGEFPKKAFPRGFINQPRPLKLAPVPSR